MTKPNLLLLHGALGSGEQMTSLEKALSVKYNTYLMDFEGHGDSQSDQDFSIELFTRNVADFLLANEIAKTNIFGYSMGGYVALNLARLHPDRIEKIVTYGTKFDWNPDGAQKETKMLDAEKIEQKVPAFAQKLQSVHKVAGWKSVLRKTAEMMVALGEEPVLTPKILAAIKVPVLIGIGDQDHMVSIDESRSAAENLYNGALKIIENGKHPLEKNDAKQLSDLISDFIGNR